MVYDDDPGPADPLGQLAPAVTSAPEPKVVAATTGAGAGVVIAGFLLWLIDSYMVTPGHVGDLPGSVTGLVTFAVSAGVAFIAGYLARHQYRELPVDPLDR